MFGKKILKSWPVLTLAFVFLLITITNWSFSGWLTGWDNLHPEFNFFLNIRRSIFAAWQEYQGLGLLGGMGHASDLPRQIFLSVLSFFLPNSFIRQAYFFLMLFLGPLGVYFLLEKKVLKNYSGAVKKSGSLAGALFYLLNLATVQAFYAPFVTFAHHFAALPWLFLATLNFLERGGTRNLLLLFLVNILSLPQAYVPTIFFVFLASLGIALFVFLLKEKTKTALKRTTGVICLTLIVNAFWLLPFFSFLLTKTPEHLAAKINQMGTENIILENKKFGDFKNVALLKGFWFDKTDINEKGEQVFLLASWREHLENPAISTIGLLLFLLVILGIFYSFKSKNPYRFIFFLIFTFSFILLANNTPPFSLVNQTFYKSFPVLGQALRFPFTKLSILASFSYSLFFGLGFCFLAGISTKRKKITGFAFSFLVMGILIVSSLPLFLGHLFYSGVKNKIPQEYFDVFNFFEKQDPNTRIANFPQHTFWGWNLYRWGYRGSGFLWYGIPQAILDRAFDPWSRYNENYYWEVSYALYSQNLKLFEAVLKKYQVGWLLFDRNVINPSSPKALYFDGFEALIGASDKISLAQTFGKIKIYKVNLKTPVWDFVLLAQNLPNIGLTYQWTSLDQAFLENGHYLTRADKLPQVYYPFRSLFTGKTQEELEFKVEGKEKAFVFKKTLPEGLENFLLTVPEEKEELPLVNPDNLATIEYLSPEVSLEGQTLKVIVPKTGGLLAAEINPVQELKNLVPKKCGQQDKGEIENKQVEGESFLRLKAIDANNCSAAFYLPNLSHQFSYLITAESRNISGEPLLFWVENLTTPKADLETYLPKGKEKKISYFIQPPMAEDGLGYALHFDNISIGQEETVNDLGRISLYPVPYRLLTNLKLYSPSLPLQTKLTGVKVSHPNPSLYQIEVPNGDKNRSLILSQSFDLGWVAYETNTQLAKVLPPLFGKRIKKHVLADNWANGFVLEEGRPYQIIIVFWPQYLEYLGFFLLGGTVIFLVVKTLKRKTKL